MTTANRAEEAWELNLKTNQCERVELSEQAQTYNACLEFKTAAFGKTNDRSAGSDWLLLTRWLKRTRLI